MAANITGPKLNWFKRHLPGLLTRESGIHTPDPARLELWVNSQVSERRRRAARALADNLNFFSFEDVRNMCKELVKKLYAKKIPDDKELIWFGVDSGKSGMFIAALCYHYAAEMGLRLPFRIFDFFIPTNAVDFSKTVAMCVDDMSYSGSQMSTRLRNIKSDIISQKMSMGSTDIRVGFISISELGLGELSKNHPYIRFESGHVIPSLRRVLGDQQYMDCIIYFSLHKPNNFTYFEHKIADDISTFMKVFKYGPVPPATVSFTHENLRKYGEDTWELTLRDLRKEIDNIDSYLTQSADPIDPGKEEINKIQFIPFINGCELPASRIAALEDMNYIKFLNIWDEDDDKEYARCPRAFYKNLKGGKRKTRRHRKSKRRITRLR
jgi:hypothetical protein